MMPLVFIGVFVIALVVLTIYNGLNKSRYDKKMKELKDRKADIQSQIDQIKKVKWINH